MQKLKQTIPPPKLPQVIWRARLARSMWKTKLKNREVASGAAATKRAQTAKLIADTRKEAKKTARTLSLMTVLLSVGFAVFAWLPSNTDPSTSSGVRARSAVPRRGGAPS